MLFTMYDNSFSMIEQILECSRPFTSVIYGFAAEL